MIYLFLLIGFVLLIKGADYFVDGSANIAKILKISPLLVGLTIVAFGTSAPEATISIIAAFNGSTELTVGNIVGSNIVNTALIVGVTAFILPLKVQSATIRKEIPFAFLASLAFLVLISDQVLSYVSINMITKSDGIIFLLFFSIFLYYVTEVARNNRDIILEENSPSKLPSTWRSSIFLTIGGLGTIIIGGYLVVENSTKIAYMLGMSETLVGLTIVAIGSSLPELVTSVTAALKKQSEIAVGNIVGSSIFNLLFILGISALISPLVVNDKIFFDAFVMLILVIVLYIFSRTHRMIGKLEGLALIAIYIVYLAFIIIRN